MECRSTPRTAIICTVKKDTPRWQQELASCTRQPETLFSLVAADDTPLAESIQQAHRSFPVRAPAAYIQRIHRDDPTDPLLLQVMPQPHELLEHSEFVDDPVADRDAIKVEGVLHKYAGRVLLITTGACAIHCRYCFRRHFPYNESHIGGRRLRRALAYIEGDATIAEVILSGGDPLTLDTRRLQTITDGLATIAHIKRLRIHTRTPVVLPARVDGELLDWLASIKMQKVMVLHVNHAREIDAEVEAVCRQLRSSGLTLLNQAVLLKGINDSVECLAELSERLFENGIIPYYLHRLDRVRGASHFDVEDDIARQLIAQLRRRLPGYLVPQLVTEQPASASKTPL